MPQSAEKPLVSEATKNGIAAPCKTAFISSPPGMDIRSLCDMLQERGVAVRSAEELFLDRGEDAVEEGIRDADLFIGVVDQWETSGPVLIQMGIAEDRKKHILLIAAGQSLPSVGTSGIHVLKASLDDRENIEFWLVAGSRRGNPPGRKRQSDRRLGLLPLWEGSRSEALGEKRNNQFATEEVDVAFWNDEVPKGLKGLGIVIRSRDRRRPSYRNPERPS